MNDESLRMMELAMQGFQCSQILLQFALEAGGKQDPDLIRAMGGLAAGLGCGKACGALTGGCCLLGLYAGKGTSESQPDERLGEMLRRFVEWFELEFTSRYGGIDCSDILGEDPRNKIMRCPGVVLESLQQLRSILKGSGFEFTGESKSE